MDLIAAALILIGLAVIITISIKVGEHRHHHHHHHKHRHPATHGRFLFQGDCYAMSATLNPGQSVSATLQAFDANNNVVPIVGTITFNATAPLTVVPIDEQNATYAAPADAAQGTYPISASFINSAGNTIEVDDSIVVPTSGVAPATSGAFVFGTPTP